MSRYVILRLNNEPNPYSGYADKPFYELLNHTKTKYNDNRPYFSAQLSNIDKYSISKEDLPTMLKSIQNFIPSYSKSKSSKEGKIFVLKTNSSKLKEIINLYK